MNNLDIKILMPHIKDDDFFPPLSLIKTKEREKKETTVHFGTICDLS